MNWGDFKQAVYDLLTVDATRQGTAAGVDRKIQLAVQDIQFHIPYYRIGHETVYQADDLIEDGEASVGWLEQGIKPTDGYIMTADMPCKQRPVNQYDWNNRNELICGSTALVNSGGYICIDPQGKQIIIYPKVQEGQQFSLFWDGERSDFADLDETPFDINVAEQVANYVKAWICKEVDKDLRLSDSYMNEYNAGRRMLFVDTKERTQLRSTATSPQPDSTCSRCVPASDDSLIEFVAFGDSGESTINDFGAPSPAGQIAHTEAVAVLVKSLRPDFVLQLGDSNYPLGDPVTLQDYLTKYYYGWIPDDFYMTFGNHDQDTDGGAALLALLPHVAAANSGKLYYDVVRGNAHFFFLNAGPTNLFDPDGSLQTDTMGVWLQSKLALSSAAWKIVCVHKPPYTSDQSYTPGQIEFRWPFKAWGANLVLSGHGHNYERILVDDLQYVICGLGGATKRGFGATTTGSQFRYSDQYGCLRGSISVDRLQLSFINTDREIIDVVTMNK